MTALNTHPGEPTAIDRSAGFDATRISARFGVGFGVCQIAVMILVGIFVIPHGGSPNDPALERGEGVLDAAGVYRVGNYVLIVSGVLLLGFLGAVQARLRQVDRSGALATVAVAAGTLLALIWPLSGVLHDVALEAAGSGSDLRILAGWDAVAPFSLAFSALPRLFFVGALVLGLRASGTNPWMQRTGVVILVLSAAGSVTLIEGGLFPLVALSTLCFEVWVGVLAWRWLRESRTAA